MLPIESRTTRHGQVGTDRDSGTARQRRTLARWRWLVLISCTLLCGLEPTMANGVEPARSAQTAPSLELSGAHHNTGPALSSFHPEPILASPSHAYPARFAFVAQSDGPYLILGGADPAMSPSSAPIPVRGPRFHEREDRALDDEPIPFEFGEAYQPFADRDELGPWQTWLGRQVSLFGPTSACTATIRQIGNLAWYNHLDAPSFTASAEAGPVDERADESVPPQSVEQLEAYLDDPTVFARLSIEGAEGRLFLAAKLDLQSGNGCRDATWARVSSLPTPIPQVPMPTTTASLGITRTFVASLPAYQRTAAEVDSERGQQGGSDTVTPSWSCLPSDTALHWSAGNGDEFAWLNCEDDGEPSLLHGRFFSLQLLLIRKAASPSWSNLMHVVGTPDDMGGPPRTVSPQLAVDTALDGTPEIVFTNESDDLMLFDPSRPGEGWIQTIFHDCIDCDV